MSDLTLKEIVRELPVLSEVFEIAERHKKLEWCAKCQKYSALKKTIFPLVGWGAAEERFDTTQAYDLVITEIMDRMGM